MSACFNKRGISRYKSVETAVLEISSPSGEQMFIFQKVASEKGNYPSSHLFRSLFPLIWLNLSFHPILPLPFLSFYFMHKLASDRTMLIFSTVFLALPRIFPGINHLWGTTKSYVSMRRYIAVSIKLELVSSCVRDENSLRRFTVTARYRCN